MLRQLPTPETVMVAEAYQGTFQVPTPLTLVRVPMRLTPGTALSLRVSLEDQVILEERMAERMETLAGLVSTSPRRR